MFLSGLRGFPVQCWLLAVLCSAEEFVVHHSALPPSANQLPYTIPLTLSWTNASGGRVNVTFRLVRSGEQQMPTMSLSQIDEGAAKTKQSSVAYLKDRVFYEDLSYLCILSISYTGNQSSPTLLGSFTLNNVRYEVSAYHPELHPEGDRIGAMVGDHILTSELGESGYIESDQILNLADGSRVRRETSPTMTNTIELYVVIDYYLYIRLLNVSRILNWPSGADNFIAYCVTQKVKEVDLRFRSILTTSFTFHVRLVHIQIAKTELESAWTAGIADKEKMQVGTTSISRFNTWVNNGGPVVHADHYMLLTGLDLYGGSDSDRKLYYTGVGYVEGVCLSYATSVCEYEITSTGMAHELAHNLGANHDGAGNDCSEHSKNVMAPLTSSSTPATRGNSWRFSECSISSMEAFINTLIRDGTNCLDSTTANSYFYAWTNYSSEYFGQSLSPGEQCKIAAEDGQFVYAGGLSSAERMCYSITCLNLNTNTEKQFGPAFEHTSCGDHKWCIEEKCVYDTRAPATHATCPLGEKAYCSTIYSGRCYDPEVQKDCCITCPLRKKDTADGTCIYGNKASTCSSKNFPYECYWSSDCCETCQEYLSPWLGPNCPYGDKYFVCSDPSYSPCTYFPTQCCDTCCPQMGAAPGYSCSPSEVTLLKRTTRTAGHNVKAIWSPAPPARTTTKLSSAASSFSSRIALATTLPTVYQPTLPSIVSRLNLSTEHESNGNSRFGFFLRINTIIGASFDCRELELSPANGKTYIEAETVVCSSVKRYVHNVVKCAALQFSCGSLVVNAVVEIASDPTAPITTEQFSQQLNAIVMDHTLNVTDFPAVYDINECSVDELNSCSPNALCTNTDGSYFCTCSEEYSSDLSPHNTSAGRVCAVACEPNYCSPSHFCEERPETSPHCICIDGIVCPLWILILSVVAFSLILSIILAVICVSKRRTQHILLQHE